MNKGDVLIATCEVSNTGKYDADEVVQLYIRDKVGSLVRPGKELKDFKKVAIKAGQSRTVSFQITEKDLAYWNADMVKRAEAGEFEVWIAPSSAAGTSASFILN